MKQTNSHPIKRIQDEILNTLVILAVVTTIMTAVLSIAMNVQSEQTRMDQNIGNIAQTIARSQIVREELEQGSESLEDEDALVRTYLDSVWASLSTVDVISVIDVNGVRHYHSNASLIGTVYEGILPQFGQGGETVLLTNDRGPSGYSRRAYGAVYDKDGRYLGFVMTVMLIQNIYQMILRTIAVHVGCAVAVICLAVFFSVRISGKIRQMLMGYEPDVFRAMFRIRDTILESLEEGILAVDNEAEIVYVNRAAVRMLGIRECEPEGMALAEVCPFLSLDRILAGGERKFGILLHPANASEILSDQMPIMEGEMISGAVCVLHDRTEYTKMMEDLTGVNHIVEGMRANTHDFINKLHVILGLIQIGRTDEASEYITHITSIQQTVLNHIIKNIDDPSVAALLIGKYARCAELDIEFSLKSGSRLSRNDISLPSGDLVTIIGNLLENAVDAMRDQEFEPRNLVVGIFTQPHAMLIQVDDTGRGIEPGLLELIFEDGFSTKGKERGTGLFVIRQLVGKLGGEITVESEPDAGTSFTVTITQEGDGNV